MRLIRVSNGIVAGIHQVASLSHAFTLCGFSVDRLGIGRLNWHHLAAAERNGFCCRIRARVDAGPPCFIVSLPAREIFGRKSMNHLIDIITSSDDAKRNTPLVSAIANSTLDELLNDCRALDAFSRRSDSLYHRVRALTFLSALHRFHVPAVLPPENIGRIPFESYRDLLERRFQESIDRLIAEQDAIGPNDGLSSALAVAYRDLAFQTLADQVRRSVRTVTGNQWMFRIGHPNDHPLRIRRELLDRSSTGPFPMLSEKTAVRMDFSHSGWSDIFFLGMDYPEGARVLNASVNLGVRGRDSDPRPPIETYFRVIDRPVLRLVCVDLNASVEVTSIPEVFDFARDYLGLLKAAVIAAGIVPPGMEGCEQNIEVLLRTLVGPGRGIELVSKVNDIPKGSRLAVSTNLLGSLISICMRATGQINTLSGGLNETERRLVAARAILGEWIGGSGGGWQDSGGVWPGIKLISGAEAREGDPEYGVSRGRLLPQHTVFDAREISAETRQRLQDSLVLVHGGMAQNVGPVLEMVTERYLLRSPKEWAARQKAMTRLDSIILSLKTGDIPAVGAATHETFFEHLQTIIPWCTNQYTNLLVERAQTRFGADFHGFWMLGGMAGGGMGFIFDPSVKQAAQDWLQTCMSRTKAELHASLPFAMEPVVYDFAINDKGTWCELLQGEAARMPDAYYALMAPGWLRSNPRDLPATTRRELELLGTGLRDANFSGTYRVLLERMLPQPAKDTTSEDSLDDLLDRYGFDRAQHEQIRADLKEGRIGMSQNRLSASTSIENVCPEDVTDTRTGIAADVTATGAQAIERGEVAVVTLAAGVGSRWTQGAGVVKALNPFCQFDGRHRSFLEVHLAKSRYTSKQFNASVPHVFTTGYMTDAPIQEYLQVHNNHNYSGPLYVSTGKTVGLRMVPTVRDLRFAWEEMPQQVLDEQQQKVRTSLRTALMNWARNEGEATDYTDNLPMQCLHPVGHWYEIPNLLRSGILHQMLQDQPSLKYLLLHNIDTLGANVDPGLLGLHINSGSCLSFEVISRRLEDRGGGLARVNGRVQLVEGLSMPDEEAEFHLSWYNSMTTWIDIDQLLNVFGLERQLLGNSQLVESAIHHLGSRLPTYVTLKEVKKRWGHGQEDVFPVSQFEKIWGDMSTLPDVDCNFVVVPIQRGQQLKEPAQLDGWLMDGSAEAVMSVASWS